MIKTESQVNSLARMIGVEIGVLTRKLTGIEIDHTWIHIDDYGNANVIFHQLMKDGRITAHSFAINNGVMSDYAVNVLPEV